MAKVIVIRIIVLLCAIAHSVQAANFLLNAGGTSLPCVGFRSDTGRFTTSVSRTYKSSRQRANLTGWGKTYDSHRYAISGDLIYSIPVPPGSYKVFLMFMETWDKANVGSRRFTVSINDQPVTQNGINGPLDVFARVGLDKPLFINTGARSAVNGRILITLGRVPGANNPMISSIAVMGTGADTLAGSDGLGGACVPPPNPTPTAAPVPSPVSFDALRENNGNLLLNAGGNSQVCTQFRADTGKYASTPSKSYSSPSAGNTADKFQAVFKSHRYATSGDLVFTLPVPAGTFEVYLMFMETWRQAKAGTRRFTVHINGEPVKQGGIDGPLDVFARVGVDKPLLVNADQWTAVNKQLVIKLGRIANGNNPMISGIGIVGANAKALVGNDGLPGPCPSEITPAVDGKTTCNVVVTYLEKFSCRSNDCGLPSKVVESAYLDNKFVGRYTAKLTEQNLFLNAYHRANTYETTFTVRLGPDFQNGHLIEMKSELPAVFARSYNNVLASITTVSYSTNKNLCDNACGVNSIFNFFYKAIRVTCVGQKLSSWRTCTKYGAGLPKGEAYVSNNCIHDRPV